MLHHHRRRIKDQTPPSTSFTQSQTQPGRGENELYSFFVTAAAMESGSLNLALDGERGHN